jgi:hypothetical protein
VTSRPCSRCHTVLHREDHGTLIFCSNCGAPQVHLSEELRDQIEKQIANQIAGETSGPAALNPTPQLAPSAIVWPGAIQCAGLAGAVAAAFGLISLVLPPIGFLSVLWFVGAPAFILIIYTGRFRQTHITASFGARLGVLSALAITLASVTLNTISLLLRRFVFHSVGPFDLQIADLFAQMRSNLVAQAGSAADPTISMLSIPEFRVGFILLGSAFFLGLYLLFAATAGAVSGYIRSRSPRPAR